MAKLLTIVSIILVILLFPPATLALISNNAVPGDATYPIKRKLEDIIFAAASVNPVSKAWFSAARSDRRFQEVNILIAQGKQASQTLQELVQETQSTADEISQIKDEGEKNMLRQQLAQSIEKYDQGLEQLSKQSQTTVEPQPTSGPAIAAPSFHTVPTVAPTAASTSRPVSGTTGSPGPVPTFTPAPQPPSVAPPSNCDQIDDEIERARCGLEKLKNNLSTSSSTEFSPKLTSPSPTPIVNRDRNRNGDNDEDKNKSKGKNSEELLKDR